MKVVLFSLRFSPGHINWVSGYYKLFKEAGHDVRLYLADSYYDFMPDIRVFNLKSKQDVLLFKPDILWIINPSEKHLFFSVWLKLKLPVKVFYYYHEPFGGLEILREKKNSLMALFACILSSLICLISYKVVVPSECSMRKYLRYSRWLNRNVIFLPLLYDDEKPLNFEKMRTYFSFIGTFAESHGTESFISFMRYATKIDSNISFLIATKSDLSSLLEQADIQKLLCEKRLLVQHRRNMSSGEINSFYAESICVWNLYTRSNQSGVLPNALMMGTPVLASDKGVFSEIVKTGYNGFVISDIRNYKEILDCYHKIKSDYKMFSENARKSFFENYYYKNWIKKIDKCLV